MSTGPKKMISKSKQYVFTFKVFNLQIIANEINSLSFEYYYETENEKFVEQFY